MIYGIDIDGVIAITKGTDYIHSEPVDKVIEKINQCYYKGDTIIIYTARGTMSGIDYRRLTESQLQKWGVKYHLLLFGKPVFGCYVGDECINVKDWIK